MQLFAIFFGLTFKVLETLNKLAVGFLQGILRINIYKPRIVDQGKQQITKFAFGFFMRCCNSAMKSRSGMGGAIR